MEDLKLRELFKMIKIKDFRKNDYFHEILKPQWKKPPGFRDFKRFYFIQNLFFKCLKKLSLAKYIVFRFNKSLKKIFKSIYI